MSAPTIRSLSALQILDSRGAPTLEVEVVLDDETRAAAMVPSGASTGAHEAVELRDGEGGAYGGRSVLEAAHNVDTEISQALQGMPVDRREEIDHKLIELDGTPNKSRLGANAILGASMAVARAAATCSGQPLWRLLAGSRTPSMPTPTFNILSGGLHAGGQIELQDFLAVPHGFSTFAEALEAAVRIHGAAGELLRADGLVLTGVADEGGWGPRLASNRQAIEYLLRAIEEAGYRPGDQVSIALDIAATHFHREGGYALASENRWLAEEEMIGMLEDWSKEFPILSIEDGLAEDAWDGWRKLTARVGGRCKLIGDDLFCTNPERLERGIREKAANAVLVKMNQIGTLTETFQVIDRARVAGFDAVISARSGETEDAFLSDLAVASGAGWIKVGSVTRSERLAKWNRLLRIEAADWGD